MSSKREPSVASGIGTVIGLTVLGVFGGGGLGLVLPFCLQLFSCVCNIVSFHWSAEVAFSDASPIRWAVIGAIIGGVIMLLFGISVAKEEAKTAAEKRQREIDELAREMAAILKGEADEAYHDWVQRIEEICSGISSNLHDANAKEARWLFKQLWECGKDVRHLDKKDAVEGRRYAPYYSDSYSRVVRKVFECIHEAVVPSLSGGAPSPVGLYRMKTGLALLMDHYLYEAKDSKDKITIMRSLLQAMQIRALFYVVQEGFESSLKSSNAIVFIEYGQIEFVGEDPRRWSTEIVENIFAGLTRRVEQVRSIDKDLREGVVALDSKFFLTAAQLMWYYADTVPFNVERFNYAHSAYNAFIACPGYSEASRQSMSFGNVEEVLARLYTKNKVGGASTAKQEEPYVLAWVENKLARQDYESCFLLVSGLAWIGLYDLEQKILRKLVAQNVQLTAELQERLGMLESGRTRNVRLFDVVPSEDFAFDSSSVDWKADEFSVFFRKLAMKKTALTYSLALGKWTKTMPLKHGQQVAESEIRAEFQKMVSDFDGEVTYGNTNAYAVDLGNVRYEGAHLFSFVSERSRCMSVLFSCEKYGRNLNVTIYTLFTPEPGMDISEMERYAAAAKSNIYMESFRESILQSLDEVLKVEASIYGDEPEEVVPSRRIVE